MPTATARSHPTGPVGGRAASRSQATREQPASSDDQRPLPRVRRAATARHHRRHRDRQPGDRPPPAARPPHAEKRPSLAGRTARRTSRTRRTRAATARRTPDRQAPTPCGLRSIRPPPLRAVGSPAAPRRARATCQQPRHHGHRPRQQRPGAGPEAASRRRRRPRASGTAPAAAAGQPDRQRGRVDRRHAADPVGEVALDQRRCSSTLPTAPPSSANGAQRQERRGRARPQRPAERGRSRHQREAAPVRPPGAPPPGRRAPARTSRRRAKHATGSVVSTPASALLSPVPACTSAEQRGDDARDRGAQVERREHHRGDHRPRSAARAAVLVAAPSAGAPVTSAPVTAAPVTSAPVTSAPVTSGTGRSSATSARSASRRDPADESPGGRAGRPGPRRRPPAQLVVGQPAAQLQDGLGVHLADAALGDAEHLPDLGEA